MLSVVNKQKHKMHVTLPFPSIICYDFILFLHVVFISFIV